MSISLVVSYLLCLSFFKLLFYSSAQASVEVSRQPVWTVGSSIAGRSGYLNLLYEREADRKCVIVL